MTKSERFTDQTSVRICRLTLAAIGFVTFAAGSARGDYAVQRVVAGLNQPTFVTQAPGDNSSLYIVERADTGNQLGRIRKYDLQTQTATTFLDLTGTINSDGGVLSMTLPSAVSNQRPVLRGFE